MVNTRKRGNKMSGEAGIEEEIITDDQEPAIVEDDQHEVENSQDKLS